MKVQLTDELTGHVMTMYVSRDQQVAIVIGLHPTEVLRSIVDVAEAMKVSRVWMIANRLEKGLVERICGETLKESKDLIVYERST